MIVSDLCERAFRINRQLPDSRPAQCSKAVARVNAIGFAIMERDEGVGELGMWVDSLERGRFGQGVSGGRVPAA